MSDHHEPHRTEERDDDSDIYGPQPVSALSEAELNALNQLREARQQAAETQQIIAHMKANHSSASSQHHQQHEEWMTSMPTRDKKAPQQELAAIMHSSDSATMRGKAFSMKAIKSHAATEAASTWTDSPLDRQLMQLQREADQHTQRAMLAAQQARAHSTHSTQREDSDLSAAQQRANASAAAAQLDEERRTAAREAAAAASGPSLLELHQQHQANQASAKRERGAPIFWDREKEMGLRRQKNAGAIQQEIRSASGLNARFQMSGS